MQATFTSEQAMQWARQNDDAAERAMARGDKRQARILKRTAQEWRDLSITVNRKP